MDDPPSSPAPAANFVTAPSPPISTDIFLSYRTKHASALQGLLLALGSAGITVWRDEPRIDEGDSISDAVRAGLADARALLVWCSEDYHDSRICRWELTRAWICATAGGRPTDRVFLLFPTAVADPRSFLPEEALGPSADQKVLRMPADTADLPAWVEKLHQRLAALDDRPLGALSALDSSAYWPLRRPAGSNRFVGRDRELWRLHGLLQAHKHVAVTGVDRAQTVQTRALGGMGKTLLAIEYALLFQGAWPGGIFWFDVGEQHGEDLLRTLMTKCGHADLHVTRGWLANLPPHLWVLDNISPARNQREVEELSAPGPQGCTLVTTRSRAWSALGKVLDLGVLDPKPARTLLTGDCPPKGEAEETAADTLCQLVGFLPLALDVLRALVANHPSSTPYAAWRARLDSPDRDALEMAKHLTVDLPTGIDKQVSVVMKASLDQLDGFGWDVLRVAETLSEAPIPAALIEEVLRLSGAEEDAWLRGSQQAKKHSLLDIDGGMVWVHPVVRRVVRFGERDPARAAELDAQVTPALVNCLADGSDPAAVPRLLGYLPHAEARTQGPLDEVGAALCVLQALVIKDGGDYGKARAHEERALEALTCILGHEHLHTLITLQNLAGTLYLQGDLPGACAAFDQVLNALTRILGPEHPETLSTLHNLASTLYAQGDLPHACAAYKRALEAQTRILGPEHPDTLTTLQNFAGLLYTQGDLPGARTAEEKVLEARTRILGPEHPDTLTSLYNLALTLKALGNLTIARAALDRAREAQTRILGHQHPDTLLTLHSLAAVLQAEGDLPTARRYVELALAAQIGILGPEHPATLSSRQGLANILQAQNDRPAARKVLEEVLQGRIRVLGPEHPDTRISSFDLALTLLQLEPLAAGPHLKALAQLREADSLSVAATDQQILANLTALEARFAELTGREPA